MNYLEAVEVIRQIEGKYDVMSIRYKGMSVWPFLRLYLHDQISIHTELKASSSVVRVVLKSLFCYNPFQVFKHHNIWLFAGCERRKRIGEKMIHRVSGGVSKSFTDCLMIEKPDLKYGHCKRNEIEEKYIVSEAWLLILFHILKLVLRLFKLEIENEALIQKILLDNGLDFDYRHYIRSLNAKRHSLLWLMAITKKPKLALMEVPYDSMGYMWAFHQKGVKVIEMQHGVAGASHNAYNAKAYESGMNPDGICVYGSEEYRYFTEEEPQYTPKVFMTGLYMLEKTDIYFKEDVFSPYKEKYENVIVCSGQSGYENELAAFVNELAKENKKIMFVYIPRNSDTVLHLEGCNVKVAKDVNIYQYLKWADIHMTISSTTCLEAQYYQKPTIFFDYFKRASTYYSQQLKKENGAFYIENPKDFLDVYNEIKASSFSYRKIFAHNHIERINKVIREYIDNE